MAVIRSLIARLSAETGGFEAGMGRARKSLRETTHDVRKFSDVLSRDMLRGLTPVQKARAVVDEMRRSHLQAAFAEKAHAEQARQLTRTIEELAEAEAKSVAITKQAAQVQAQAAGGSAASGGGFLSSLKSTAKLAKMGGILFGVKYVLHQTSAMADEATRSSIAFRNGEMSATEMGVSLGKSVPLLGAFVEAGDSLGRAFRELRTGELAAFEKYKERYEAQLGYVSMLKDLELKLAVQRKTGIDREIVANRIAHEEMRMHARQITSTREQYAALNKRISESETLHLQDILNAEKMRTKEVERRAKAEAAKRWASRFGSFAGYLKNDSFSGIRDRLAIFNAGRDFFKGWFSGGQESTRSKSPSRDLQSASFGSSGAAAVIARAIGPNQIMLDKLDAIRKAIEAKAKNTITVKEIG